MQVTGERPQNKWLKKAAQSTGRISMQDTTAFKSQAMGHTLRSEESPSMGGIVFSLGESDRVTSKQLKDLLNKASSTTDKERLSAAVWSLLDQAKRTENQLKGDQNEELGTTSLSLSIQSRVDHAKFRRSALVQEQEALRIEILDLDKRLNKLELLKESTVPVGERSRATHKHQPVINQRRMKPEQVREELLVMGVKKELAESEKIALNDREVQVSNGELARLQHHNIGEMSKYQLLQLKKPKYALLMDRLARIREPNEPHELKLLKKVIKNVNLLYAKINEVDLEMTSHRLVYGQRVEELQRENEELTSRIRETRDLINKMNVHQAFKESDLKHLKATEFLEANPVPYNFASIIRDYKLLDVFGDSQK